LTFLFLTIFPALLLTNCAVSSQAVPQTTSEQALTYGKHEIINIDGDVSLNEAQNRIYWNPHSTGLTDASTWSVTFENETKIFLKTVQSEAGHVATGAWWTTSFKTNTRIPLYTGKPQRLFASFRANIASVYCQSGGEWLRIALAFAVKRSNEAVVYTEMDFWDSPNILTHPSGNIKFGGNIVYQGGDVVEYKIDQAAIGEWKDYSLDLTRQFDSAWSLKDGDLLESVYIVVETIGGVTVTLKVDDLWIARVG
jgi:hypothetical protein